jgi:hypothetical protein
MEISDMAAALAVLTLQGQEAIKPAELTHRVLLGQLHRSAAPFTCRAQ